MFAVLENIVHILFFEINDKVTAFSEACCCILTNGIFFLWLFDTLGGVEENHVFPDYSNWLRIKEKNTSNLYGDAPVFTAVFID